MRPPRQIINPSSSGGVDRTFPPQLRRGGFTLIELMLVMVAVAILTAMLLPVLSQAKGKARQLECLTRMKQWSMAFRWYPEDHGGWIPRECYEPLGEVTINNWSQVKGWPLPDGTTDSQDVWYNALPPLLGQPPTTHYAAPLDRAKFFETRRPIHCPAARFPPHALRPTHQFPLFSIAMNSQLIQQGPSIQFTLIEQGDPTRTVMFLDNLLEGETKAHPAQESTHLGQPGAYANRFGPRHQQGGNLSFADGHVAWYPGRDVVETRPDSALVGGPILPPRDIVWELNPYRTEWRPARP